MLSARQQANSTRRTCPESRILDGLWSARHGRGQLFNIVTGNIHPTKHTRFKSNATTKNRHGSYANCSSSSWNGVSDIAGPEAVVSLCVVVLLGRRAQPHGKRSASSEGSSLQVLFRGLFLAVGDPVCFPWSFTPKYRDCIVILSTKYGLTRSRLGGGTGPSPHKRSIEAASACRRRLSVRTKLPINVFECVRKPDCALAAARVSRRTRSNDTSAHMKCITLSPHYHHAVLCVLHFLSRGRLQRAREVVQNTHVGTAHKKTKKHPHTNHKHTQQT
jgi:hypothetical protein